MKKHIHLVLILSLFAPFLTAEKVAYACSCIEPASPSESLEGATAVFSGKVTQVSNTRFGNQDFDSGAVIVLETIEYWKGAAYKTAVIHTGLGGGDCGLGLVEGEEYLIYAYGQPDRLTSNICTRTRLLANASEDVAVFGAGRAPIVDGANESVPENGGVGLIVGAGTAVIIAAALAFFISKRRQKTP